MALPLLPFAVGVGIGALITYAVKDGRIQQKVVEGARRASGIGHEGLEYLSGTGWPGQTSTQAAGSQRGRAGADSSPQKGRAGMPPAAATTLTPTRGGTATGPPPAEWAAPSTAKHDAIPRTLRSQGILP